MIKPYYIYAWFNVDTESIFYIGMGKGSRAFVKDYRSRSQKFIDYYKTHNCEMMFLEVQLSLEEASEKETEYIRYYKSIGQCECNITLDGKPGAGFGEDNPNYKHGNYCKENNPDSKYDFQNGRAISVDICNEANKVMKSFPTMSDCADFLIKSGVADGTIDSVRSGIGIAIKNQKPYRGLYFRKKQ